MKYTDTALPAALAALAAFFAYRYGDKDHEYQINQQLFYQDAEWCWARVPNTYELFVGSLPLAALYNIGEYYFQKLDSGNPTTKSVVRDGTKIISAAFSWWSESEIGGTHVKYDVGNLYGSVGKFSVKALIITSYEQFYGPESLVGISRVSNYLGEIITRAFALISKEKQSQHTADVNYMTFASDIFNTELAIQSTLEGLTKSFASDQCGQLFSYLGISSILKQYVNLENYLVQSLTGTANAHLLFWDRAREFDNTRFAPVKKISFMALDIVLKLGVEMATTAFFAPPSRIAQDAIGDLVKHGYEYAATLISSYYSKIEDHKEEYSDMRTVDETNMGDAARELDEEMNIEDAANF
jgi:hypothetical protein